MKIDDRKIVRRSTILNRDTTVGKPGPYVSAFEIECPWCGAQRYEGCRNSPDEQRFRGIQHVHGLHGARVTDADLATAMMRALME